MQSNSVHRTPRHTSLWRLLAISLLCMQIATTARAGLQNTGRWTPSPHWVWGHDIFVFGQWQWQTRTPVHLTLIPGGSSGHHSRLLFYDGDGFNFPMAGGMWGWSPGLNAGCADTARRGFTEIPIHDPPASANLSNNIFCSSHVQIGDGTSRVLITGGTEFGEVGITDAQVFDPDATTQSAMWTSLPDLSARRWYPTATKLGNGKFLVASGSKYAVMYLFGGRDPAAASGAAPSHALRRLGLNLDGTWDPDRTTKSPVTPPGVENIWPGGVMHHAMASQDLWQEMPTFYKRIPGNPVMVGGEHHNGSGIAIYDKTLLMVEASAITAGDEDFYFRDITADAGFKEDVKRADAVMFGDATPVAGNVGMVLWGGRDAQGPRDRTKLWHLRWRSDLGRYEWVERIIASPNDGPGTDRYGSGAFYHPGRKRIFLWGGTTNGVNPVTDQAVYSLDISNPTAPLWRSVTVLGAAAPSPRFGHRMLFDNIGRRRASGLYNNYRGVLFGGRTALGLSNETWSLWVSITGDSVEWKRVEYDAGQSPPDGRAYHVMTRDEFSDRMVVFGGQRASGTGDLRAWALPMPHHEDDVADNPLAWKPAWDRLETDASLGVEGAAFVTSKIPVVARTPDLLTLGASPTTQPLPASSLRQELYPFNFVLPNGKLFTAGPGTASFTLDAPGAGWQFHPDYANANAILQYAASAAMYLPGKVMISGSKYPLGAEELVSNQSQSMDVMAATPRWLPGVNAMFHRRVNHNLVVMPNGHVAAIGGTQLDRRNDLAILQPEIWDPSVTGTNQRGQWYQSLGGELLASHQLKRGYHSVALLLPDGRILSCGGNDDGENQNMAEIFCPPYLFKNANGDPAPRPEITGAPAILRPGATFTICTPNPASVTRACLIAPGAPTHGFDQNQRYIPLAITTATSGAPRLFATAPADSNVAPPGDYLLFLTGASDQDGSYPDVPSIARWVRVVRPGHADDCDAVAPATMSDLTVEVTTPTAVFLSATAPGDDGMLVASGTVSGSDLRYNYVPITSGNWESSYSSPTIATFDPAGGQAYFDITGLNQSTSYAFAFRTRDDAPVPNWSGVSNSVAATTTGGGGGGNGYALQGEAAAPMATLFPSSGALIAETQAATGGAWTITLSRVSDAEGFGAEDSGWLLLQDAGANGAWEARRRMPIPHDVLGLCALRAGGRTVVLGDYAVQRIATRLHGPSGSLELASAVHSRLGDLNASAPEPLVATLEPGDVLILSYGSVATADQALTEFATIVHAGTATGASRLAGRAPGQTPPQRFALLQNAPNPFGATTAIGFELPRASRVRIELFDLLGRRVRTLTDQSWPAGRHAIAWDRLTDRGERLSSGVLLYRMTADGFRDQKKLVIGTR